VRNITIQNLNKSAYDIVLPQIESWWGNPARHLFHSIFLYHFAGTSLIASEGGGPVGILIGFNSQTQPDLAYIHAVATAPSHRRIGLGRLLYESFFNIARRKGRHKVQAQALPDNLVSLSFHRALGFEPIRGGAVSRNGVWIIKDYAGPGIDRVVLTREI
jgi:predicted GNAT superfamily acetyltransferase